MRFLNINKCKEERRIKNKKQQLKTDCSQIGSNIIKNLLNKNFELKIIKNPFLSKYGYTGKELHSLSFV